LITEAASLLHIASEYIDEQLPHLMRRGLTYPAARARALEGYLSPEKIPDRLNTYGDADYIRKLLSNIISEPNNILGVEYVRALHQISSSITPVTIQRACSHYHDRKLTGSSKGSSLSAERPGRENEAYSSATSIRNIIEGAGDISGIAPVINSVPGDVYAWLTENYNKTYPVTLGDFSSVIRYKLLHEDKEGLSSYLDISPDLAERILNLTDLNMGMSDLIKKLKTRNLTQTRINRALIHLLLSIREDDVREYRKQGYVFYARILGIKKSSTPLLRKISKINQIPVITKLSKAAGRLDSVGNRMLKGDIRAAHIYNQAVFEQFGTSIPNEYKHGISMI
jgi:predicted nucleotidyltransferase